MTENNFTTEQRKTLDDIVKNAQVEMTGEQKRYLDISRIPLICFSIVNINKSIEDIKNMIRERDGDHESRIRVLETNMWKFVGIGIVVAPVIATIVTIFITKMIK